LRFLKYDEFTVRYSRLSASPCPVIRGPYGAYMPFHVQPELMEIASRTPSRGQLRAVSLLLFLGVGGYVGFRPFVETLVSPAAGIVAIQSAGLAIIHLLIALLLTGQLQLRRSAAVSILAFGFLISSIAACAYTLLFPGLFNFPTLAEYSHANDWLYITWHGTFSLCVLGYALASKKQSRAERGRQIALLALSLLLVSVGLYGGLDWIVPALIADRRTGSVYAAGISSVVVISVLALAALVEKRPHAQLDLWLSVAMVTWLFDIALAASFDSESFDLGLYIGRLCSLLGALLLLCILGIENLSVHVRLRSAFDGMIEARARQKSNEVLAAVLRNLPEGVFVFDGNDNRPIVNERGMALIGSNKSGQEAMAGNEIMDLVVAQANRAVEHGNFENEIVPGIANGDKRVFSVSGAAIRSKHASLARVVVISDVTERIRADEIVREYLERLHALLENTPLAAIEWGSDRIVRRWSKRAEELFGWPASEVLGKPIDTLAFIYPDDAHSVDTMADALINSSAPYIKSENRNVTRDRRVLQCEWHNSALRNERGGVEAVFSLALDITERKLAMERLEEADHRKDVFIATLAHELRNPLAPIANAASLLLSQGADRERVEWIASMISRQSARMGRLLDELLDVSRISRGKIDLRKEPVNMGVMVHEALQVSLPLIESARHHVGLELLRDPVWVEADPVRVVQIMSNLVNNAAKYTPPKGRIDVRLARLNNNSVFTVHDNGIGIEPEMLPQVFEAFVQVGSASHLAQGGLGIGLSLAKGLAELHGGTLTVASEGRDRGCTFTLCLPLAAEHQALPKHAKIDEVPLTLQANILVADDNVDAADSLALLLRARGAQVVVAYDGEQALQKFTERPADIVILDLGMPCVDGLEVARQLSQAKPRPFLIALTGRGRKEDHAESLLAGFDEHLIKPVDLDRLGSILQAATRQLEQARTQPSSEGAGNESNSALDGEIRQSLT
jgi:PAS domain S-box-containing protein